MNIRNNLEYKGKCFHCGVYVNLTSYDALFPVDYENNNRVYRVFVCTHCGEDMVVIYFDKDSENGCVIYPEENEKKEFSPYIDDISPKFVDIYNQALQAKCKGLDEICGIGYRKAIEFLVKDYAIFKKAEEKTRIESLLLSQVINKYIPDSRAKSAIERATWLGNDETHYTRIWNDKNIEDLEKLIDIFIHFIDFEFSLDDYEKDMQKSK